MPNDYGRSAKKFVDKAYGFARRQASEMSKAAKQFNVLDTARDKMKQASDAAVRKAKGFK